MKIVPGEKRLPSLTDTDIVAGLRSDEPERRRIALEALCGMDNGVLVVCSHKGTMVSATNNLNVQRVFAGLLFVAQQVAKHLNLALHWVPEEAPDRRQIVIAPGDALPPMPG